jgi:hypothetical protein
LAVPKREAVVVTTDSSGAATAYAPRLTGRIHAIIYEKTDFDNGVDFTITAEATAESIWAENNVNASKVCYPRPQVHDASGTAKTYDGTRAVGEPVVIVDDRVKIVIAQGGASKTGTFYIVVL